jgi:hypothetical protein
LLFCKCYNCHFTKHTRLAGPSFCLLLLVSWSLGLCRERSGVADVMRLLPGWCDGPGSQGRRRVGGVSCLVLEGCNHRSLTVSNS